MQAGGNDDDRRPFRAALGNSGLVACSLAAFANTVVEWAMYIAALVYAFAQGGAGTAGAASIAILLAVCVAAPLSGITAERRSPARLLFVAHLVEAAALVGAAVAAVAGWPTAITIACCAVAQGGITFTRPAMAVLTPAIVRSARELTVANVWASTGESASILIGPLVATLLLAISGAPAALAASAALGVVGALLILPTARREPATTQPGGDSYTGGALTTITRTLRTARERPGAVGVLGAIAAAYVLVGAMDLLLVVFAHDELGFGDSGPGLLSTSIGVGAVISSLVASRLVRRRNLAPLVVVCLIGIALATALLGTTSIVPVALVLLPLIGFGRALVNLTTRMLLQRSAPPGTLAPLFALVELLAGVAMVLGSLGAQALIRLDGARLALFGIGGFFVVVVAAAWRPLRKADDGADVPVVAISLLRRLPLFQPLPPLALEAVARAAVETTVAAGEAVVSEGEAGDHFYAIADGEFEITRAGQPLRGITRGMGFGEVALLADVPRTATVWARTRGSVLAIGRAPFLEAVTGCDSSHTAAWTAIREWGVDVSTTPVAETPQADARAEPPSQ